MTLEEVLTVLAAVAASDAKAPSPSRVTARVWADLLNGVPVAAALEAVREHYRTSSVTITPDVIVRYWRARHQRATSPARLRLTDPETQRRRAASAARRGMATIYAATGWTRPPAQAAALSVPCPVPGCGAPVGVICAPVNRPEPRDKTLRVHPARRAHGHTPSAEPSDTAPTTPRAASAETAGERPARRTT